METLFLKLYQKARQNIQASLHTYARNYPEIAHELGLEEDATLRPPIEKFVHTLALFDARFAIKSSEIFSDIIKPSLKLTYPHCLFSFGFTRIAKIDTSPSKILNLVPAGTSLNDHDSYVYTAEDLHYTPLCISDIVIQQRPFIAPALPKEFYDSPYQT